MNDQFQRWREQLEDEGAGGPDLHTIRRRGSKLRTRRRALLAAPGIAVVAGSAALLSTAVRLAGDESPRVPAARNGAPSDAPGPAVSVTTTTSGSGRIAVNATPPEPAPNPAWMEHELVFENRSREAVTLSDFRAATFLPSDADNRLLVADEGCGYGFPDGPSIAVHGCDVAQGAISLPPGASDTLPVTLFVDLRGMKALQEGEYELTKDIRVRTPGGTDSLRVVIVYDVRE